MKKLLSAVLALLMCLLPLLGCAEGEEELKDAYYAAFDLLDAGETDAAYAEMVRVAELGYAPAMYAVGYYLDTGDFSGGAPDREAAVQWWLRAVEAGDDKALQALGHYYAHNADPLDFAKAEEYLLKAAEAGLGSAMHNLGVHYGNGDFNGGTPDPVKAKDWYIKSVEAGNEGALGSAIELCANGAKNENGEVLLATDHQKLYEILVGAYDGGTQKTVVHDWLGWMYAGNSDLMEADYAKAYEVYMAGANLGSGYCMAQLGCMYRDARIGVTDTVAAQAWFTKAVEAGYEPAQEMLDMLTAE